MSSTATYSCRVGPHLHSNPYLCAAVEVQVEDIVRAMAGKPDAPVTLTWHEGDGNYRVLVAEATYDD